jgi:hypothetical protein
VSAQAGQGLEPADALPGRRGWVENSRARPAMPSLNGLMMDNGAVERFLVAGGVRRA